MKTGDTYGLNSEQEKAVKIINKPLLIIAGAGTGKTHVIVEKIKYLIKQKLAKPDQILALTFTEKAAFEMEERVDQSMPYGYFQTWISTFHAFADSILKVEAQNIGLSPNYRLMTEAETLIFLRQNLFLFDLTYYRPLGNPNKFLEALSQHFSRLRDENIAPDEYVAWTRNQTPQSRELANAFKKFQLLKIKAGVFDFADLVFYLLQLFKARSKILKKYQQQFSYVLVDEFQDTNIAQYELIKLLCPPKSQRPLTVVGDDSQAIYKFRGASVSNILSFMKDYRGAKQITLCKNYRSNQTILDNAYQLIKHNDPDTLEAKLGISKELIAQKKNINDSVKLILSQTVEEEADYLAEKILKLSTYKFSDFALLVRANNHAEPFIRALSRHGIPYQFLGQGALFKQPEVKDLIAYLKVLNNLEDSVSLFRLLTMDIFKIDSVDLNLLLSFAKKINLPLFQTIEIYLAFLNKTLYREEFEIYRKFLPLLRKETKESLSKIYNLIRKHLDLVKKETAGQLLYYFLEDSGILSNLVTYKTEKEEKKVLNITKFFSKLKTFESEHENAGVSAAVDYIDMSMELGESPIVAQTDMTAYNAVNILTVHSSKGLEFPVVFLVNLTRGRFPTYERKDVIPIPDDLIKEILPSGDYHEEEERRLFYVGITRAIDRVYLSAARFYGEGKREQRISPFVIETLGEELYKNNLNIKKEERAQLSIFDFKKAEQPAISERTFIKNFSYTQLETYERCPLQYKYQFVLKVPTPPVASASFGDTIHRTLQQFYQEFLTDKSLGEKRLLEIYKTKWIPLGYASPTHENRMKKEGTTMLQKFFNTFHDPKTKVIDLEKLFKIKIGNDIFITGKIDRVDAKGRDAIEIIDYKTGRLPNEKELKKNIQLSVYALAATNPGLYNKKLNNINLTFYYLQDLKKISVRKTDADLKAVLEKILNRVKDIRSSDFSPKVGPWCNFCPFRMICEAWQ